MTASIFISFASKDHRTAETICDALENRGYRCWISNRDVLPGHNYQESISRAIRSAKVMLLVFTANANNSDEIKKELALASRSKIVVIPLRVEDVVPNDAFDYEFATRQWIDLFDGWEAAFKTLTAQIATIVPPQLPLPGGAATASTEDLAYGKAQAARSNIPNKVLDLGLLARTHRTLLLSVGLAVLVAGAGYYLWHHHTASDVATSPTIVDLSGAWCSRERSGSPELATSIDQNGRSLTFHNEHGNASTGHLVSDGEVVAEQWAGGLHASVADGRRLDWTNGSVWRKSTDCTN